MRVQHQLRLLLLNNFLLIKDGFSPCMYRKKVALHFLIICTLALIIYFNHFQNEFVYDDAITIHRNFDIKHIKRVFSSFSNINTRPLVRISYATNYYISHLRPLGYHVTPISHIKLCYCPSNCCKMLMGQGFESVLAIIFGGFQWVKEKSRLSG